MQPVAQPERLGLPAVGASEQLDAAALKAAGNAAFKAKDYDLAVTHYTAAVEAASADADRAVLLVNRAMARLKLAAAGGEHRTRALEAALEDARRATAADARYAKGHFRVAQACLQLGKKDDAVEALRHTWLCAPGDAETAKLLREHDECFAKFDAALKRSREAVSTQRENLKMMTHNSHPRTLRVTYFKTWMA
eukprot:5836609-Prymnesium_polylepis.1